MSGIFDEELILPGVITDIMSEYSSEYDASQFGTTDSVTIIGTAFNGPVGKPVKIYSVEHAKYIFGAAYDSATRREATLVAEIQDAWDRGCRTIYAVRVSGQEVYKDFALASDVDCKLRVSGIFPSNDNKEVYFQYDAANTLAQIAAGEEATIKVFKPANRATIAEKMSGKVTNDNAILVNTMKIATTLGISKSTRLTDFITAFNSNQYNNVIKLTIVDNEGNDITNTLEAQGLSFGDMYPGVYLIGRDKNNSNVVIKTDVTARFVPDEDKDSIYEGFSGNIYKELIVNTDATAEYPIFHTDVAALNMLISKVDGVTQSQLFDFLGTAGKVNILWPKDSIDYEEVDLTDFDMYKKLGSGFTTTAQIVETRTGTGVYKVVETTGENNANRIAAITDGIYSVLENHQSDYRVLAGRYADSIIKGKLPKKSEFLVANPLSSDIWSKTIAVSPIIDTTDVTKVAKNYKFELRSLSEDDEVLSKDMIIDQLYQKSNTYSIFKYAINVANVTLVTAEMFEDGDLILDEATTTLHLVKAGHIIALADYKVYAPLFANSFIVCSNGKVFKVNTGAQEKLTVTEVSTVAELNAAKYVLADVRGEVVVFEVTATEANIDKVIALAFLRDVLEETSSMFAVITPESDVSGIYNKVVVRCMNLHVTSLGEFVILLNEDRTLGHLFEFNMHSELPSTAVNVAVLPDGSGENVFKEAGIDGVVDTASALIGTPTADIVFADRGTPCYSQSLYVPYKTTDNFARQLAQHVIYTGLKTAPTHGVIGCSKLTSTNLKNIANRVNELVNLDLNLYAKKANGNDMLDKDNMPYNIGRGVSVTCFQHNVVTSDNYTYVSAGAAGYAGMISKLPIDQSSTSQTIKIDTLGYEYTNYQLGQLTQAGFVAVKTSNTKGYVVVDGVTMAPSTSPFRRLSVARIINSIDDAIRDVAEPYIGKQNHLANRNSLHTAIKSVLDKLVNNLIESYSFNLSANSSDKKMGVIDVEYVIIPIYEIREVRNRITVKDGN